MSDLRFGIEINAKDKTQSGLKSALAGVTGFARGAMGALRDFNLGLKPAVAGLDNLIERGAEVEVIRKAFERMTNSTGRGADALAKKLVSASSGTLRLAEGMAIANRALGSGMKFNDVATAIEFVGKKSIATGKDARQSLDTVITGLSRGSTLFLDDFGILVDGLEGVKRSFDSIKGKGAFDSLGPAAAKAETIRQAIGEMTGQMGRLGVSGRETIFLFQGMKNAIGDMTDKLVLAVATSAAMKTALGNVRDILAGLGEHFDAGGGFMAALTGKGQSGGLLGILKAGALDAGETFARTAGGGLLLALGSIPELFTKMSAEIGKVVEGLRDPLNQAFKEAAQVFADEMLPALKKSQKAITDPIGEKIFNFRQWMDKPFKNPVPGMFHMSGEKKATGPLRGLLGMSLPAQMANLQTQMAMGGVAPDDEDFPGFLKRKGREILNGGGPSRLGAEIDRFRADFPLPKIPKLVEPFAPVAQLIHEDGPLGIHPFTQTKRMQLLRENARDKYKLKNIAAGGQGILRDVNRDVNDHVRDLRRQGFEVRPAEVRAMKKEALTEAKAAASAPIQSRIAGRLEDIEDSDRELVFRRRAGRQARDAARVEVAKKDVAEVGQALKIETLITAVQSLVASLSGETQRVAGAK